MTKNILNQQCVECFRESPLETDEDPCASDLLRKYFLGKSVWERKKQGREGEETK